MNESSKSQGPAMSLLPKAMRSAGMALFEGGPTGRGVYDSLRATRSSSWTCRRARPSCGPSWRKPMASA
ncbi:hypothetical protein LOE30_24320 (plasmid) [Pseudosulfitobacter pseudonitzschiae]|uniref:hypothetical protein n=1 Tax=Pseudosulfitobacter pseudonitzschiae TaxID=1402135 RepID=UPI001E639E59|nr:hypothetical protein [Pseudosulfitobacter pseudonitzschiae]UFE83299.1 hypothetical protein LOE30_24320 [Pseudosulfitobacter pseudonitzschiae]